MPRSVPSTVVPAALRKPDPIPLADRVAWSVAEAARALGVSERMLSRLIREGVVPASRLGRRVLLDPAAVRQAVFGGGTAPQTGGAA
jgi:excisionase family DNA binding protein